MDDLDNLENNDVPMVGVFDRMRRLAIESASGYDDDAFLAAWLEHGIDSDEALILHPANFLTEDQIEALA